MKNIEKHIDRIAELVGYLVDCSECPCYEECKDDDEDFGCGEFFKRWAMKEVEEDSESNG